MEYKCVSLNGDWTMAYLGADAYSSEVEPEIRLGSSDPTSDGFLIKDAVPAYWEDMTDKFRATRLHMYLRYNPLYTDQRYPQSGYVPDMALPNVVGSFGYTRTVNITAPVSAEEIRLYIGGAQNATSLWVNGHFIGRHEGYSSPFDFTVPREFLTVGENRVTLSVSNTRLSGYMGRPVSGCTSRAANECTGGIYGDVELRAYSSPLRDAWVNVLSGIESFEVNVELAYPAECYVTLSDGTTVLKRAKIEKGGERVAISTDGLTLWSPECPKRYTLAVECLGERIERLVGIRRFEARGTTAYLNGRPIFVRGICEHGYYPMTAHPEHDKKYYLKVIRYLKELGFNFIRFHTWVPVREYIEAADELGMLMEVETPNNTTVSEWADIVRYTRRYTAPVLYSSGNEMVIDEDYIEHLRSAAELVHRDNDALFSPMSAMRGVEYFSFGDDPSDEPFLHNPRRLALLGEFADVYNTYSLGDVSYTSERGVPDEIDRRNAVYKKPLFTHEICINGTYCDLSLADRYRGTRIGDTRLFSSVEEHLRDKGLLNRAPIYFKNSSEWQRRLRKHCFETVRRSKTFAGYDYLGDIDHHWHTFGYCVGMMNEFYELKPGESVENVRRYNADTVLLADLPRILNLESGARLTAPILVSNYGDPIASARLDVVLKSTDRVYYRREIRLRDIPAGEVTSLYELDVNMPKCDTPAALTLSVRLSGGNADAQNEWELYLFPRVHDRALKMPRDARGVTVTDGMTAQELTAALGRGERVLIFGTEPFASARTNFQISLAGRTEGHLATFIDESSLMQGFPHSGFCSWQFREMMNGGRSILLDLPTADYAPVIEIASAYKNARREALVAEYRVGDGRLLVCGLNLRDDDPGARWLKARILSYAASEQFDPETRLSFAELAILTSLESISDVVNANAARNANDITM